MSARSLALRAQNEQIVTFTLVELLTQLVFVAMLLAFVLRNEALHTAPGAEEIRRLNAELAARDKELHGLRHERDLLREELNQEQLRVRALLGSKGVTLPYGTVSLSQEEYDALVSAKLVLQAKQKELASAKAEIAALKGGKGGNDLPSCTVTSGFLLDIALLGDGGFEVVPSWDKGAPVAQVPGLPELGGGQKMSLGAFQRFGNRVHQWGLANPDGPCAFRAIVRRKHGNAGLFERQFQQASQSFYVAIRH